MTSFLQRILVDPHRHKFAMTQNAQKRCWRCNIWPFGLLPTNHFITLYYNAIPEFMRKQLILKAHVHPNGFACLCFCFETILLSNAVFWLASTFEELCVTILKTTAREISLQLNINIRCRRNLANTLSVEFAAKSFFRISPEIKKTDPQRQMYFGDLSRCSLPTVRFSGAAIESTAVKQTLTATKRLDTRPKYPERCKEKNQKHLFRLPFKQNFANCGRLTRIDSTH